MPAAPLPELASGRMSARSGDDPVNYVRSEGQGSAHAVIIEIIGDNE
jgi:hypothetical protein